MKHPIRLLSRTALVLLAASMLLLNACSSAVKSEHVKKLESAMDLKIEAYKSGQFLLDGAVLSAVDLNSHFAYLKDQHRLPKTVLITKSDDAKVGKKQLLAMARMQLTYGFTIYYDKDGKLVRLEVADKRKIPELQQYSNSQPLQQENQGTDAKGVNHFPTGGGSGGGM